jgi:hypothetical protein
MLIVSSSSGPFNVRSVYVHPGLHVLKHTSAVAATVAALYDHCMSRFSFVPSHDDRFADPSFSVLTLDGEVRSMLFGSDGHVGTMLISTFSLVFSHRSSSFGLRNGPP